MNYRGLVNRGLLILLFPLSLLMVSFEKANPYFIETFYSLGIYVPISRMLSFMTSFIPYSVFEFLIYMTLIFSIIFIVKMIAQVIKSRRKIYVLIKKLLSLCSAVAILYFCFTLFWALNYYRLPVNDVFNYDVRPSTTTELKQMCDVLTLKANELRLKTIEDDSGVFMLNGGKDEALKSVNRIFSYLNDDHFSNNYNKPKRVLFSKGMSVLNVTGIYSPFTAEANVNMDLPDLTFMATACHEAAHQRGYAREDEANYIAWHVIMNGTQEADYRYSAVIHALIYSMNALHKSDSNLYYDVSKNYSEAVKRDIIAHKRYWDEYDTEAANVHETVNDYYLKSNNQADGVKSYGRMVDLLLGQFRDNGFE